MKPERGRALRQALRPHVAVLVDALMDQGMTRTEALRSIRWATYSLTEPDMEEAPPRHAVHVFGGEQVQP